MADSIDGTAIHHAHRCDSTRFRSPPSSRSPPKEQIPQKIRQEKKCIIPNPAGNGLVSHNVMPAHARCCEPARKITKIANAEFSARSQDSIESTDLETPGEIEPRTNISSADASKDARRISYTLRFHVLAFPSSFFDFCRDAFEFMNTVRWRGCLKKYAILRLFHEMLQRKQNNSAAFRISIDFLWFCSGCNPDYDF